MLDSGGLARRAGVTYPSIDAEPDDTDEDLARAASCGDEAAFRTLYARHRPGVAAFVTKVVGAGPDRDDVVQEVFLQLYRALATFRGDARLATFLRRIAMNVTIDHLRRRTRHQGVDYDTDLVAAVIDTAQDLERHSSARQQLRSLLQHMDGIAENERRALQLVAIAGLSLHDAATQMGANAGWVKQRVMRARRELTAKVALELAEGRRGRRSQITAR